MLQMIRLTPQWLVPVPTELLTYLISYHGVMSKLMWAVACGQVMLFQSCRTPHSPLLPSSTPPLNLTLAAQRNTLITATYAQH